MMDDTQTIVSLLLPDVSTDTDQAWQRVKTRVRRRRRLQWSGISTVAVACTALVAASPWSDRDTVDVSTDVSTSQETGREDGAPAQPGETAIPVSTSSTVSADDSCDLAALDETRDHIEQNLESILDPPSPTFAISTITPTSADAIAGFGDGAPPPCSILLIVGRPLSAIEAERLEAISGGTAQAVYGEFWSGPER